MIAQCGERERVMYWDALSLITKTTQEQLNMKYFIFGEMHKFFIKIIWYYYHHHFVYLVLGCTLTDNKNNTNSGNIKVLTFGGGHEFR